MGQSFAPSSLVILNLFQDNTQRQFIVLKQIQDDEIVEATQIFWIFLCPTNNPLGYYDSHDSQMA
jgi:hypothetical protein